MKTIIIDRATWYRGRGSSSSKLLREDGSMCCLGFLTSQCGLPNDQILNKAAPVVLNIELKLLPEELRWLLIRNEFNAIRHSTDCMNLMSTNDNLHTTDADKEALIVATFAKHDLIAEFIN